MDTRVLVHQQKTYIHQLCADTGYNFEDLSKAMTDTEKWWETAESMPLARHDDDDDDDNNDN